FLTWPGDLSGRSSISISPKRVSTTARGAGTLAMEDLLARSTLSQKAAGLTMRKRRLSLTPRGPIPRRPAGRRPLRSRFGGDTAGRDASAHEDPGAREVPPAHAGDGRSPPPGWLRPP